MFKSKFTTTHQITNSLASIEKTRGFLEAIDLNNDTIKALQQRALILEAHHTTHIEGTQLTLDQSKQILLGKNVRADQEDIQELLNYRDAFELVSEYLQNQKPISEGLIREIRKKLVQGVRGNSARPGEYRTVQNYVVNSLTQEVIYTPPPAFEVSMMMKELTTWFNQDSEIHPILVAGIGQFQLVHIHPFLDGNGRAARLLSTLHLYRCGYDFKRLFTISEYYDRDKAFYYQAIQSVRNNNMDMTSWLEYFTLGLAIQLKELRLKSESLAHHVLDLRQNKMLEYVMKHGSLDIQNLQALFPEINRRTLQREIKELIDKKILSVSGSTNNRLYTLNID